MNNMELEALLRDRELVAWAGAGFCHWVGCEVTDDDLMEEDHIYILVNYQKLVDGLHWFQTSYQYPYKVLRSWTICSSHHSKATQMRIRGEESQIAYPERLKVLLEQVEKVGQELVERSGYHLEDFRMPEVDMRGKFEDVTAKEVDAGWRP